MTAFPNPRVGEYPVVGIGLGFRSSLIGSFGAPLGNITQIEVDFGPVPQASGYFIVADPRVSAGAHILVSTAYEAPTGKDLDEIEMDDLEIRAGVPSTGTMTLFIHAADGSYLHDKFKLNYEVGH